MYSMSLRSKSKGLSRLKNDIRVRSTFDKVMFDPSLFL